MFAHDTDFRRQLDRERCESLARDYRLAQRRGEMEIRGVPRVAWLPRRLRQLSLRRGHAPAYTP